MKKTILEQHNEQMKTFALWGTPIQYASLQI